MEKETLQYNAFHLERRILWFCGIYSGKDFQSQKRHFLRAMGVFLVLLIFDLSMLMKIIVDHNKLEIVFQTAYHIIVIIIDQIKTVSLYRALSRFNNLEDMLRDPIFNTETSTRCTFIAKAVNNLINLKRVVWRMTIFIATLYSLMALINGNLPIPLWCPSIVLDMFNPYYQLYEVLCIWVTTATISTDLILIGLLYLMSAQIKTLNFNLRNVTDTNPDYDAERQEKQVQDNLRISIRHHLAISDFVSKLEEIFSFGLFLQIFSSIIAISAGGVYMVFVTLTPSSFIILVSSMTMILAQIAMYCWVGQGLLTESDQIGESCYMSEWYTCNIATRKMFFIIMERSKRVISFKAGKFFELSFTTLVMIIKNAYSYFTVIITAFK
uniref:Odorant receptor n=1 Tax=Anomala corpulenta TaxID=931571 RepID=A0A0E3Y760_9SCAR|nr:odorant receptor 23 [Anomala corpulenta]